MEKEERKSPFSKEELMAMALEDAITISDRFAREPVLARTGKGYYKSAGVEGLQADLTYLKSLGLRERTR